jgi:histidyl-tRNA synthetase
MALSIQPYKGARDFYPEDKRVQKYMFAKIRQVVESYGYQEFDAPLIEPFEIYAAKSGDELVNEQLYSFEDRGGRKVAIRPEMTPSVSRMVAGRRQELAYPARLYSIPNLWRYERPQKGRLREHWQLNVDLFGIESAKGDAEIIQVADSIMKSLGATPDMYEIRINSRQMLDIKIQASGPKKEFSEIISFLDKKNKMPQDEFFNRLSEYVNDVAAMKEWLSSADVGDMGGEIFKFKESLQTVGITNILVDPSLTRGFDYYTDIVFEVFDKDPENNRSMFGGGRYDGLVAQFGVEPLPTVGFGMGDVTLLNFLQTHNLLPELKPETSVTAILIGDVYEAAQAPINQLRAKGINVAVDSSGRKIDSQIKNAVKSGVRYALFIGESELGSGRFKLRDLAQGSEEELDLDQAAAKLSAE